MSNLRYYNFDVADLEQLTVTSLQELREDMIKERDQYRQDLGALFPLQWVDIERLTTYMDVYISQRVTQEAIAKAQALAKE